MESLLILSGAQIENPAKVRTLWVNQPGDQVPRLQWKALLSLL